MSTLLDCSYCFSTNIVEVDIGTDEMPSKFECEDCGHRFDDPEHENAA